MRIFRFLLFVFAFISMTGIVKAETWIEYDEAIDPFEVMLTVHPNTSVSFQENLHYHTDIPKHGIFRFIPYRYQMDDGMHILRFSGVGISADQGEHPYEENREGKNLVWKIGDPDKEFEGNRLYQLKYTLDRTLLPQGEEYVLRWDIVGDAWNFPIMNARATLHAPGIPITNVRCFAGAIGSQSNELCTVTKINDTTYEITSRTYILSGHDVTLEATFPQSAFQPPSTSTKIWWWLDEYAFLFFLPLPLIVMAGWWYRSGRDWVFTSGNAYATDESQPKFLRPLWMSRRTPMMFEPLPHLTPGEAGFLLDERIDNQDIVAEILELARKKYIKIERVEESKLFGLSTSTDYRFISLKKPDATLPAAQMLLHEKILGDAKEKKLSELKGTFAASMELVKKALRRSAMEKKLFTHDPEQRVLTAYGVWIGLGVVVGTIVFMGQERVGATWAIFAFLFVEAVAWLFVHQMVQKTAVGTNAMLQARGLRQTIKRGAWREKIKEKHLFIEEVLPFAVSLGVINQLTKDMDDLALKPPQYASSLATQNYAFGTFMNDFQSQTGSSLSYNPNSSGSGSGGSSSGGGFGGGGGGSW